MPKPEQTLLVGQFFLAVEGLALIRTSLTDPDAGRQRIDEIRTIVERYDEFPQTLEIPLHEHDVEEGYTKWAPRYDGPNPAIATEEPVVHELLATLPVGTALDAACGTGRHAAHLAALGHTVIGVDATEAMLDVARAKLPDADLRHGRLEALPVDDASIDVLTCALALTHVPELGPPIAEFGRVLRPGGSAVLSDIHPFSTMIGGPLAGFSDGPLTNGIPYVRNRTHHVSEYVDAFNAAGLTVRACRETFIPEEGLAMLPTSQALPDATRQAFLDTPHLLVWHVVKD